MDERLSWCFLVIIFFFIGYYLGNFKKKKEKENFKTTLLKPYNWRRGSITFSPSKNLYVNPLYDNEYT